MVIIVKIKIKKPLNHPRLQDRKASWLLPIQIKVEKSLGRYSYRWR